MVLRSGNHILLVMRSGKSYSNRSGKIYNAITLDKRLLKEVLKDEKTSKNIQEYENIIFEVPLNNLMQQENEEIQNVEKML
ncbi:hypothetical protein HZH66_013978 [Vespula vulgaris]|uniref:Uncharacterized protein n=1 Tax=Vespula vulgaris TaxID=7454 RepID=A0A834J701_VESVU|nr:hypothetical protein HZH66_013978 [Vespula vulgaris]